MNMSQSFLARKIAKVLWLGPLGLLAVFVMHFLGISEDATYMVAVIALVLMGFTMLLAILILNISKKLTSEDRKSWRLLFFFGGPFAACAFLTCKNLHVGPKPLDIILGDKRK